MTETRERTPSAQKMSMPPGDSVGDLRAPTINVKNVNDGPPGRRRRRSRSVHHQHKKRQRQAHWEAVSEIRVCPPLTQKMLMSNPLGGAVGDLGVPPINIKNVDGRTRERWWWRS
jgi:hypothetical protein